MARYADVEAILAEETLVPVTWRNASRGLGRALDPGADTDDIAAGTQIELPLWLIRSIANRNMVELHLPGFFGSLMQKRLRVGAAVEDLAGSCPHFYDAAQELDSLLPLEDMRLAALAVNTFRARYKDLLMQGLTRAEGTTSSHQLQQRLTTEEALLFQAARVSVAEAERWHSSDVLSARSRAPKRKLQARPAFSAPALEPPKT